MNLMQGIKKYDAILVAGEGGASYKIYRQHKAFLKIGGRHIVGYVIDSLQKVNSIKEIYVVGKVKKLRRAFEADGIDLSYPKRIHFVEQKKNLYENIWHTFLQTIPGYENIPDLENSEYRDKPVLIVPCDSPLITPHEVDYFINHSDVDHFDHILGLTAEEKLKSFYGSEGKPGIHMAYLHMKEKSYRLNNLHMVKPLRMGNRKYIQLMYQYRYQRNFKNLLLLGLNLFGKDKTEKYQYYIGLQMGLFFASLGWESLVNFFRTWVSKKDLERSISNIMKTRFVGLEVPYPGAALDIDNAKDFDTMRARFDEWQNYLKKPEHILPLHREYIT